MCILIDFEIEFIHHFEHLLIASFNHTFKKLLSCQLVSLKKEKKMLEYECYVI